MVEIRYNGGMRDATTITLALAAMTTGCVDVHVAQPEPPDICAALPATVDLTQTPPPEDLAATLDLLPPAPRMMWLAPPAWTPVSGGWIVGADGALLGSGTLRARVPPGASPIELLVDYSVSAGSSARVWLRAWKDGATADTTPGSTSLLVGVKTTNLVLDARVSGAPEGDSVVDITDDGIGGPGSLKGVRLTIP